MMSCTTILLMVALLTAGSSFAWVIQPSYDESAVPEYELPDPLVFENGSPVASAEQWAARRAELLELFRGQMFGRVPDGPEFVARVELIESDALALDGKATRSQVRLHFTDDDAGPGMDLLLYLPNGANGPVPVFFGMNFDGNHTVHADPAITLPHGWVRNRDEVGATDHRASEAGRGVAATRWPIEAILARGYGLATVYYGDVDPDFDDGFVNGVHRALGHDGTGDAWGAVAAWAWGYSRALDYLASLETIDAQRIIAIGHSRLGKTALWAAAEDERFAMSISNNSGCAGAAISRRRFGETIFAINERFPHWFCTNYHAYSDNEAALPFDQHELLALIAPRPVYVASAEDDRWADPRGEFLACVHASPVYELLGAEGLGAEGETMPPVNTPLHTGRIGYHLRTGGHDLTGYDWERYLDFADQHLGSETDE